MLNLIYSYFAENPALLIFIIPIAFVLYYIFKGVKFIFKILFYIALALGILYFVLK